MGCKLTLEKINKRLDAINNNIIILNEEYISSTSPLNCRCSIHNCVWETTWSKINSGYGCPKCATENRIKKRRIKSAEAFKTFADMYPDYIKYFKNKEEAYKYSYGSKEVVVVKCDLCGKEKNMIIRNIPKNNVCSFCSDSIPYPEKIVFNVLKQILGDDVFNFHITFDWSDNKEYDFYIPKSKCIIETHGGQHYKNASFYSSFEEQRERDIYKEKLAKDNGIENYIVLDCRKSELEWIKNSILNSRLSELFDLSSIDWVRVEKESKTNLLLQICEEYNKIENASSNEICRLAENFKMAYKTILKYLKRGAYVGICQYDSSKIYSSARKKKVICLDNNKTYESVHYLSEIFFKEFKIYGTTSGISFGCRNKKKYKGLSLMFLEDYKKGERIDG